MPHPDYNRPTAPARASILEVLCYCPLCSWAGTVGECEPDVDGEGSLGCPACGTVVVDETRFRLTAASGHGVSLSTTAYFLHGTASIPACHEGSNEQPVAGRSRSLAPRVRRGLRCRECDHSSSVRAGFQRIHPQGAVSVLKARGLAAATEETCQDRPAAPNVATPGFGCSRPGCGSDHLPIPASRAVSRSCNWGADRRKHKQQLTAGGGSHEPSRPASLFQQQRCRA